MIVLGTSWTLPASQVVHTAEVCGKDCPGDVAGSPYIVGCPRSILPFCIERVYNLKQTYSVITGGWGGEATNEKELEFS